MKKITLKKGLIGGITFSAVCFVIYQTTLSQSNLELQTPDAVSQTKLIEPAQESFSIPKKESPAKNQTQVVYSGDIAYQTPKTFPDGPFAPSIADTEIDGSLKADVDGNLIIDLETRDLFDYFMNTVADVPPEVAIAELEKLARSHLPQNAVNQAMRLLGDYLLYKETALTYENQELLPLDQQDENYQLRMLEVSFETLKEIRRNSMSPDAVDAFFGLEEAYGEFTLASIKIQKNPDLSPEQRQVEIQAQRERLPEIIRNTESRIMEDMEKTKEISDILLSDIQDSEVEATLRQKGLSENAVQDALAYREQQFQFEAQYRLYQKERDQLMSAGLSEEDLESQKERLLQKYFKSEHAMTQAKVKDLSS